MTTNQTPEQELDAAVERVMADVIPFLDKNLGRVRAEQAIRTELKAMHKGGRRDGMVEGLEKGCNALHWIKSRVAATSKQKQDVIEWDETLHQAIREAKALATPTETKPTEAITSASEPQTGGAS